MPKKWRRYRRLTRRAQLRPIIARASVNRHSMRRSEELVNIPVGLMSNYTNKRKEIAPELRRVVGTRLSLPTLHLSLRLQLSAMLCSGSRFAHVELRRLETHSYLAINVAGTPSAYGSPSVDCLSVSRSEPRILSPMRASAAMRAQCAAARSRRPDPGTDGPMQSCYYSTPSCAVGASQQGLIF